MTAHISEHRVGTIKHCRSCGRSHMFPRWQAAPQERRETVGDFIRAFLVALLLVAAMASLTFVVAASQVAR
jgi:hypothetical protein